MVKRRSSSRRSSTKTPKKTKVENEENESEVNKDSNAESQELLSQECDDVDSKQSQEMGKDGAEESQEADEGGDEVKNDSNKHDKSDEKPNAEDEQTKVDNQENREKSGGSEENSKREKEEYATPNKSSTVQTEDEEIVTKDCNETEMEEAGSVIEEKEKDQKDNDVHKDEVTTDEVKNEEIVVTAAGNVKNEINDDNELSENKMAKNREKKDEELSNENSHTNIVDLSEFDATDSQLCVLDETVEKKSTKCIESEKENLGLRSGSDVIKGLMQDLADMNRLITRARNELQTAKAHLNNTWKKNF